LLLRPPRPQPFLHALNVDLSQTRMLVAVVTLFDLKFLTDLLQVM